MKDLQTPFRSKDDQVAAAEEECKELQCCVADGRRQISELRGGVRQARDLLVKEAEQLRKSEESKTRAELRVRELGEQLVRDAEDLKLSLQARNRAEASVRELEAKLLDAEKACRDATQNEEAKLVAESRVRELEEKMIVTERALKYASKGDEEKNDAESCTRELESKLVVAEEGWRDADCTSKSLAVRMSKMEEVLRAFETESKGLRKRVRRAEAKNLCLLRSIEEGSETAHWNHNEDNQSLEKLRSLGKFMFLWVTSCFCDGLSPLKCVENGMKRPVAGASEWTSLSTHFYLRVRSMFV